MRDRIARAKERWGAIGRTWEEFIDEPDPFELAVEIDDDGRGTLWVRQSRDLPASLALDLAEMLQHLRAALDACVYQAAIVESSQDPPPNAGGLGFPIYRTRESFDRNRHKIAPIKHVRLRDFIEDVQPFQIPLLRHQAATMHLHPFHPRGPWLPEGLDLLNDWARKDRHRLLQAAIAWPTEGSAWLECSPGVIVRSSEQVDLGPISSHRSELATFVLDGWDSGKFAYPVPNMRIKLMGADPPPKSASDTLADRTDTMIRVVEKIVIAFEVSY